MSFVNYAFTIMVGLYVVTFILIYAFFCAARLNNEISQSIDNFVYQIPDHQKFRLENGKTMIGPKKMLGKGSFGSVCVFQLENKGVAVKIPNVYQSSEAQLHELSMLKKANPHPNIIALVDSMSINEKVWIIMEMMQGSLRDLLNYTAISVATKLSISMQITNGLVHLHNVNSAFIYREAIIHQDLKTDNILVDKLQDSTKIKVKITDFGLAREHQNLSLPFLKELTSKPQIKGGPGGTMLYMAPEILAVANQELELKYYSPKVDVFSLGVILFELATIKRPNRALSDIVSGELPEFAQEKACNQHKVVKSTFFGLIKEQIMEPTYPRCKFFGPIIDHCIQKKPEDRYSARQALEALKSIKR